VTANLFEKEQGFFGLAYVGHAQLTRSAENLAQQAPEDQAQGGTVCSVRRPRAAANTTSACQGLLRHSRSFTKKRPGPPRTKLTGQNGLNRGGPLVPLYTNDDLPRLAGPARMEDILGQVSPSSDAVFIPTGGFPRQFIPLAYKKVAEKYKSPAICRWIAWPWSSPTRLPVQI